MIKLALLSLFSTFTLAPEDASERYVDCLLLIENDLETGRRAAQIWTQEGGGADAQHCLAMADIAAGFPKLAAARLEMIAQRKDAGDDFVRARLLAQAAEAWLAGDKADFAEEAIAAALEHSPGAGELHLTAALVYAAKEAWPQVIENADTAEEAGFFSVDVYVARGRAKLAIGDTEAAAQDVVAALSINAFDIDALTLRGDVQRAGVGIEVNLTPIK
ncbi:MAG: hypothetical protein AAFW81_09595 [Pseudomonadota bacterium]